ncbi:MAG: bifunctional acyl-ACP--phospholipid O-acyltransferase/long-chain-fatty-acid--ACP ligase [Ignavibacteria bacterium CG22_combo_CG10-13_8_21_14_all_37_15]|nr:AMP-binding protein [Ignavibacteria bacterium]NCS80135.1 AMP-binding protein [Ignavibacteria bacterium]PIP79673.1 MAG: bifunctional acyl-ACP--phospholipid O-acyltransferase/long-chain-fatty-acid--ACP ligase [Ignavibacteria bacterium CG22_combo_CG10-13_8_21_14_all_37_15]PIS44906.1 MAG: bifunctional acyl-ACP--phospholipid O-acyltransferase/long-chain-fatty-acid--ACP ligase [Ignavibacteria bacterium CG08_land_8_20_14_0_20_37_9]PJC59112.1 MAG: bifunctional acyl-ACP--phospholipid O-acyltransferas
MLLHQQFVRVAKKHEKKLAIIDKTLNRKLTYKRALIGALILSKKFEKYESGFLGIMLPNSAGSVLAILGTLMSGRIPVMINYSTGAAMNSEFAQKKCAFRTIITSKVLCEKINCRKVEGMIFLEDIMKTVSILDKLKAAIKASLPVELLLKRIHQGDENDTLLILFTSGSEKDPKGVQLTHKNITQNYESLIKEFSFTPDDIFLANLPYFHVFGQTANLWVPLSVGMSIVTYANPLDFKTVCEIVRDEKVTLMAGTPTFFWGYLRNSKPGDFQSTRILLSGADKCPDALRKGFMEKHGKVLLEAYGATETSPAITVNTLENNRPGSVGRPINGVQVMVENYETGETCKVGEIGKILVKGDNVMKGYFDDFEQTSLSIRHGWYDTGDMGYKDEDGYLWHVGRLKRFLKIGGEMVSLIKVEDVLEKLLPPDVECCVVEVPDPIRGARIVAAVTQQVDEKATLSKMAEQLPGIAMPYKFVILPEMPKLGSGKIDFKTITEKVRDIVQGR